MARYRFDEAYQRHFIRVCAGASSMSQAALQLGMNYKTLCTHAKRLGCFQSNQPRKGVSGNRGREIVPLSAIFDGSHRTMQSHKIKLRLIKDGYKAHQCEHCGLSTWLGAAIPLELHHRNGNRYDHALANLMLLCPNCHALTDNYRAKNIRNLSAPGEIRDAEPLKFGEAFRPCANGHPEPSPAPAGKV